MVAFRTSGPYSSRKLPFKVGMGLVALHPHDRQGDDRELGMAQVAADLLDRLLKLAQADGAIDARIDRDDHFESGRSGRSRSTETSSAGRR